MTSLGSLRLALKLAKRCAASCLRPCYCHSLVIATALSCPGLVIATALSLRATTRNPAAAIQAVTGLRVKPAMTDTGKVAIARCASQPTQGKAKRAETSHTPTG